MRLPRPTPRANAQTLRLRSRASRVWRVCCRVYHGRDLVGDVLGTEEAIPSESGGHSRLPGHVVAGGRQAPSHPALLLRTEVPASARSFQCTSGLRSCQETFLPASSPPCRRGRSCLPCGFRGLIMGLARAGCRTEKCVTSARQGWVPRRPPGGQLGEGSSARSQDDACLRARGQSAPRPACPDPRA